MCEAGKGGKSDTEDNSVLYERKWWKLQPTRRLLKL